MQNIDGFTLKHPWTYAICASYEYEMV